jgi:hypothetical protein
MAACCARAAGDAGDHDPKLSHAEALWQSILAMIDAAKSDAEADPRLWAPFVVVGGPAKAQQRGAIAATNASGRALQPKLNYLSLSRV